MIGAVTTAPAVGAVPLSHASHASPVSAARPGHPALSGPDPAPPGTVSWSVEPASATGPDTRTIYKYLNIQPGSTIFDHVAVFNRGSQAAAFSIYATDATGTTSSDALTLLPANSRPFSIGAWTAFPGHGGQLSIIIPGGKGVILPFTIKVPRRATPGDHIGGMIAAVGVPHRASNGQLVTVYERIAVPIELRITGKLVAALTVESVSIGFSTPFNPFGGGSAHVTYSVANTGNVLLAGTQVVTVTGPFGAKSTIRMHALPTILPGDSVRYSVSSGGLYPAGSIGARVAVTPAWPKDAAPLPVSLASASASGSAFALPWALLVLVILLAGGFYGWRRLSRGRRRAHQAEIALAAERARIETERRLLGGSNGKSGAKSAFESTKSDTSGRKPAASGPKPAASGPKPTKPAGSTAKPSTTRPAAAAAKPVERAKPVEPAAKSARPSPSTQADSPNGVSQPE
jgi:type II secretory pathway pseudopilin PulG